MTKRRATWDNSRTARQKRAYVYSVMEGEHNPPTVLKGPSHENGIIAAIREMMFPSDPRFAAYSGHQILEDLEYLGIEITPAVMHVLEENF